MSNWWAFLDWYENLIVYPLAIVALVLLLKAKRLGGRVLSALLLVLLFLPHIQKGVGGLYFDHLCRTQAGEFIYRTVDNVEGILQMRPRDGSKDYFDRMRAGDIPEDPYGHTNWEAQRVDSLFVNPPWSTYRFLESPLPASGYLYPGERIRAQLAGEEPNAKFRRFYGYDQQNQLPMRVELVNQTKSLFAFTWSEESRAWHRLLNVHVGELRVFEIGSKNLLGRRIGFYRSRPASICAADKDDNFTYRFVSKVARPTGLPTVEK